MKPKTGLPVLDADWLRMERKRRLRVRLWALPVMLLCAGGWWLAFDPPKWMDMNEGHWFAIYALLNHAQWIFIPLMALSLLALVRGRTPQWLLAQLSLSEKERQKKTDKLGSDWSA
jgi:hypothetical protein